MSTVDVTILDPVIPAARKRHHATRPTEAPVSLDGELGDRRRWLVVAESDRSAPAVGRGTARPTPSAGRRAAVLDYAAWHAHLAGTRSWAPGGGGAISQRSRAGRASAPPAATQMMAMTEMKEVEHV